MGYFILKKEKDGQFAFTLHSPEGETLLNSERYESKDAADSGIDSMRTIASFSSRFNRMRTEDDQHYFMMMAANDQVMGTSTIYNSMESMEHGIEAVMQYAPVANLVDETTA